MLLCQHGHYLAGGDAAVLVELCLIKRQAELGTGDFPGIQVQRHGVHQGAIHVEDQGVVLVESGLFTLVMIAGDDWGMGASSSAKTHPSRSGFADVATFIMVGSGFDHRLMIYETIMCLAPPVPISHMSEPAYVPKTVFSSVALVIALGSLEKSIVTTPLPIIGVELNAGAALTGS